MASTGVALAGVGLVVASGVTSGQFSSLFRSLGENSVADSWKTLAQLLVEFGFVALLAFMADSKDFHALVIAVIAALWILWGITYAKDLTSAARRFTGGILQ
jgi:hypothetical protein